MNPNQLLKPPPLSPPFLIRAPLSSEDNNSSSEISTDGDSEFGSESEPASEPATEPESMPVARLTVDEDGDGDEAEEEEGDGVSVRIRVVDDENPCLGKIRVLECSAESEEEFFYEVDRDLDTVARVSSSVTDAVLEGNPNLNVGGGIGDDGRGLDVVSAKDEISGGGLGETSLIVEEDEVLKAMGERHVDFESEENGVFNENLNLTENSVKYGVDELEYIASVDGTHKEIGDFGVQEKKDDFVGIDCSQRNMVSTGEMSLESREEDKELRPMEVESDTVKAVEEYLDTTGQRVLNENLNLTESSVKNGVDELKSSDSIDRACEENANHGVLDEKYEILGTHYAQRNTIFARETSLESMEEDEDMKPMEVESGIVEAEKDGLEEDLDVVQPEEVGSDTGPSKLSVLDESSNAEENGEKDRILNENLMNLTEFSVKNGVCEIKFGDSADETHKDNGDHGALDEKDEIVGTDCTQRISTLTGEVSIESIEVKSRTTEIEMDEIEDSMHKGLKPTDAETREISNAIADLNQEQDDEDGSVVVDSSESEISANKIESRNDKKVNKKAEEDDEDGSVVNSSESKNSVNKLESRNDNKVNNEAEEYDEDDSVVDSSEFESSVKKLESKSNNNDDEDGSAVMDCCESESSVNRLESRNDNNDNVGAKLGEGLQVTGEEMIRKSETEIIRELLASASSSAAINNDAIISSNLWRILSDSYPAFLGSSVERRSQPTILNSPNLAVDSNPKITMTEEEQKLHHKIELIRVKFLRLVYRLGYSLEEKMVTSGLYHLERIMDTNNWKFSFQTAEKAMDLEREEKDKLDFSCTILVIGKAGVGKSATINSIFEEEKSPMNLFNHGTSSVRKIEGVVNGIKIQILDTPGLKLSSQGQVSNIKILSSLKKYMKKYPPDVVLYMDRLDIQTRDFNDLPLLRTVTSTLGPSIWSNAIIALTHAASAPPEGPNGKQLSFETYIEERSYLIQQSIRLTTGDMNLMRPVALVENSSYCRRNTKGERVLSNGCRWRSKLLLLCCRSKILSEANSLSPRVQDSSPQNLLKSLFRSPPMQLFLSLLFEQKSHPKLSSDIDLDDFSDDEDEEYEYDKLPPFSPLTKSQIAELSKDQKRLYFDEYDYRFELLKKKQWKEQIRTLEENRRRGENDDICDDFDDFPTSLALLQDIALPLSFDCDDPVYRYRSLEPSSNLTFSTDFVTDSSGWDHDYDYDGVRLQKLFAIASKFPGAISVDLRKDKKEFIIKLDSSISAKHRDNGSTLANFNIQTIGDQRAYSVRGETKFKNFKKNKTTAGFSVNILGDTVATGVKLGDQVSIGKRVELGAIIGAVRAEGDVAYGANLEAKLMKKDYPIGQALAISGLSLVQYRGNLAFVGNLQAEIPIGRNSKMILHADINNEMNGRLTVKPCTSDPLVMVLIGLLPFANCIFRRIWRKFF